VIEGQMTIGGLAAGVLLTNRIIQPTLRIEALIAGERDVRPAVGGVQALLASPMRDCGRKRLGAVETLELDGVGWSPGDGRPPLLRDVSLTLRRGDCISVSGADGSGRSLLLSLMAGQRQPTQGEIRVNGTPLRAFDPADVSRRVSRLDAQHTMLDGTLLQNMTAFEPEANRDSAFRLSRELGIDGFISGLPRGFTVPVASRGGVGLPKAIHDGALIVSGLVNRPDVVLFDEANLGLDHRTDAALIRLLAALRDDVIMVLVTYRPSLRALARRHFHIAGARLSESPLLLTAGMKAA
jgi:ATP-binding cassette subfamily C protein LapB